MTKNFVIVKDTFEVPNKGTVIVPDESLPFDCFGKKYRVLIEQSDASTLELSASVESVLLSAEKGEEIFTYYLPGAFGLEIKLGSRIRQLNEQ